MTSDTMIALATQQYEAVRDVWKDGHFQHGLCSTKVTFLSNNSIIWRHNITLWRHNSIIRRHNSSTMMRGQYWKILSGQYDILSQYATLRKFMWPGINQTVLTIYIWHIANKMWLWHGSLKPTPKFDYTTRECNIFFISYYTSNVLNSKRQSYYRMKIHWPFAKLAHFFILLMFEMIPNALCLMFL